MVREIVVNFGSNAWYRMCRSIYLYADLDSQPTFLRNDKFYLSETSVSITKLTLINSFQFVNISNSSFVCAMQSTAVF